MRNRVGLNISTLMLTTLLIFSSCVDLFNQVSDLRNIDDSDQTTAIFAPPAGFNARQASKTTVLITWNAVEDAMGYKVERAIGEDGIYEEIYDGSETTYTDTIDSPGTHRYFYRVTAYNNDESASTLSKSVVFQAIAVNASEYANIEGATFNDNGVYGVKIVIGWEKPDGEDSAYVEIQRSESSASGFTTISTVAFSEASEDSEGFYSYSYIDNNATAKVAKKYYYRARILNDSDHVLLTSEEDIGWGALTPERYMIEYNKVMNTAMGKLDFMYRTGGLLGQDTNKLGKEIENPGSKDLPCPTGNINGVITYDAQTQGLGARIIIELKYYADFYIEDDPSKGIYFMLNGFSNTSSSMTKAGFMDGTMTCTDAGMYPGTVCYGTKVGTSGGDGIKITNAVAAGNSYIVTPNGFPSTNVIWNESNAGTENAGRYKPGLFRVYQGYNAATYPNLPSYYPSLDSLQPNERTEVNKAISNPDPNMKLPWLNW